MIFYYVRHGDPIYDPDSLTDLGKRQANALAKRFALYGLDEIYCSTSMRAQMTAQPTCDVLNKEKTLLDWTNECYAWDETTVVKENGFKTWAYYDDDYRKKFNDPDVRALGSEWYDHPYFANTPFKSGIKRVDGYTDEFMLNLGFKHDRKAASYTPVKKNNKRIALFAHEGFGKMFLSSLLDIPYPLLSTRCDLGHSSVTVIYFDENGSEIYPRIFQWSNDSHLYKEGELTGYQNSFNI